MSTEENKAVIRRWFQTFNDRDFAAEAAIRAANFLAHVPGAAAPLDNEGWPGFVGAFAAGFPDFRLELEELIAEGDRVAARWTFHGTQTGEFLGIPPTGRSVRVSALEVNRLVDGQVAEHWVILDQVGLLQQLGASPAPR